MTQRPYEVMNEEGALVKMWIQGVPLEDAARQQLRNVAGLPFIHKWVAAMPDVHWGRGATVGSVIPTKKAIIPAAVGVDLGCGMMAVRTSLRAEQLPDHLFAVRSAIEAAVPHGREVGRGKRDRGSWGQPPSPVVTAWAPLAQDFERLVDKHPRLSKSNHIVHLGTLGTGNHFIELCLDEADRVWVMLHSGSRGVGNAIGSYFIELAKKDMERWHIQLPDKDLAYFSEGAEHFDDYIEAVDWAQRFARANREQMMRATIKALRKELGDFSTGDVAVNCHHNYVAKEHHYGEDVYVTRKGAVRAGLGELGIIPGCFAAGTRVLMANGLYKNIEDVRVGDRVIAGDGTTTTVKGVFAKGRRPTWRYRNNAFHAETSATPDHLHFVGDMSSSNIQTQGRLKIMSRPNRDGSSKYRWAPLREMVPSSYTLLSPREIDFADMPSSFRVESNGFTLESSYALGYVFGTFLGDGTCRYKRGDGGQVSWALGLQERDLAERIVGSLASALGIAAKTYPSGKCLLVIVHNAELAKFFTRFGKRWLKALPDEFWCCHADYMRGVADGLFDTDGHENAKTRKFTNTSASLIEQYGVIHFLIHGYFPSVGVRAPSAGGLVDCSAENCRPSYRATSLRLPPLADRHQCIELLAMDKSENVTEVFDIEVEHPDHSFIANNAIVHNSMGAKSYIVRGKGNPESFCSCSHGAGRSMSRAEAKRRFTLADHIEATANVECRKDADVIDETPMAYKSIEAVMAAQASLVDIEHTLRQVVCVKG